MDDDPKKRREDRKKFLLAILSYIEERRKAEPTLEFISNGPDEAEIASMTGLSRETVSEISDELSANQVIRHGSGRGFGPACCLTPGGLAEARNLRYEESGLAGRRRLAGTAKAGGKWLLLKVAAGIAAISTPIVIIYRDQIIGWVKIRLGL